MLISNACAYRQSEINNLYLYKITFIMFTKIILVNGNYINIWDFLSDTITKYISHAKDKYVQLNLTLFWV